MDKKGSVPVGPKFTGGFPGRIPLPGPGRRKKVPMTGVGLKPQTNWFVAGTGGGTTPGPPAKFQTFGVAGAGGAGV